MNKELVQIELEIALKQKHIEILVKSLDELFQKRSVLKKRSEDR